jgi:hypothetical protein
MEPTGPWGAGNHMVALNYQTPDIPMQINGGKFRENGGCGYVLKPEYMYDSNAKPSPPIKITGVLLSGQQLPKKSSSNVTKISEGINPYVTIALYGLREKKQEFTSKSIINNGFNPIWNQVIIIYMYKIFLP